MTTCMRRASIIITIITMIIGIDAFLWRALLAGVCIALIAGPLGCVVVWRRMAYFGDTLSHAALMGVALGLLFGIDLTWGVIATCVLIGLALLGLQRQQRVASDTLLGILAHASLAIGLIAASNTRVDLTAYLFGDILVVSATDLAWMFGGALFALAMLAAIWRPLIALTVHEDTAIAEGVGSLRVRLIFMLLIALTVALAMKVVGVLLITALLIIPAAAARTFARNPEVMALGAVVVGLIAVGLGLGGSVVWDAPSGPSIVAAAAALFAVSHLLGRVFQPRS